MNIDKSTGGNYSVRVYDDACIRFYDATRQSEIFITKKDYDDSIQKLMKEGKVDKDVATQFLHYGYWQEVADIYGTPSSMKFVITN